jgi:adenine phosphoribosyltransferase
VAGFDARGFIFGPPIALALGLPFCMIRKAGKLPGVLVSSGRYETEYSSDETVMRLGSVSAGDRVLLVDDLIATGGTAIAGFELVDQLGAEVCELAAIIELPTLGGVEKIHAHAGGKYRDVSIFTVVHDSTIGAANCADPPAGTPRVVAAQDATRYSAALAAGPAAGAVDGAAAAAAVLQAPTAAKGADGEYAVKIGIIGGSGLDDPDIMQGAAERFVSTPYGDPSDALIEGTIAGVPCCLLARHGRGHTIMPTNVPYAANIYALKAAGCTHLVVSTAVGILTERIKPGTAPGPAALRPFPVVTPPHPISP